jgi:hypothetical protein
VEERAGERRRIPAGSWKEALKNSLKKFSNSCCQKDAFG